jgi:hypothetical protein
MQFHGCIVKKKVSARKLKFESHQNNGKITILHSISKAKSVHRSKAH